jgi:septum formation protein
MRGAVEAPSHQRLTHELPLILGSGSPRRREILSQMGVPILVLPADVDESVHFGEAPHSYIERIVTAKLSAALTRVRDRRLSESALLVADTLVTLDGAILGKPLDNNDSIRLLSLLNGRVHEVLTRYAIWTPSRTLARTIQSQVEFRKLSPAEVEGYAASGEGSDKAGSYALQGKGAALVRRVQGSVTSVIGLPAAEVSEDLAELGLWETFV